MSAANPTTVDASSPAIETSGLTKRFGKRVALAGMAMAVQRGAVYVLVGPNGAGKTTTLRILLDLVRADAGSATVLGHDSVRAGASVRALSGYVPERQDAGYGWMKVQDLLAYHASYRPTWDAAYAKELMARLEVRDHTKFGKLSKGESRRVQLVMALAHRPPVLLLDEPTDGLDPEMRHEAISILSEHVGASETTTVISTHLVYEVEGLGDRLGVLKDGVLKAELDRDTLRARLRRYSIAVPDGWAGIPELGPLIVRRNGGGREVAWTVWGEEKVILGRLNAGGATVRSVEPLTLEDAAVALLGMRANQSPVDVEPAAAGRSER